MKSLYILVFLLLFSFNLSSQSLFPFEVAGLHGYMDTKGYVVIPPRYYKVREFKAGFAQVAIKKEEFHYLWTWINEKGERIDPDYVDERGDYDIYYNSFQEGLRSDLEDGKYGFIDRFKNVVIPHQFFYAGEFSCGWAAVKDSTEQDGTFYTYIDKVGNKMPKKFEYAGTFRQNLAAVETSTGYGVINVKGEWVVQPSFHNINGFDEGLAPARKEKDSKVGYINTKGEWAIPPMFDTYAHFQDGVAQAKLEGKNVVINQKGEIIIPASKLEKISIGLGGFSEGAAPADDLTIPRKEVTFTDVFSQKDDPADTTCPYGFIDKKGAWIIQPQFRFAEGFKNGLAEVTFKNKKKGYINKKGEVIWEEGEVPKHFHPYDHLPKINFSEDFQVQEKKWFSANSTDKKAQIINGKYHVKNSGPNLPVSRPMNLEGFMMEAVLTWLSGENNKSHGFGMILSDQIKVEIALAANGYYKVSAWIDGEHKPILKWTQSDMVSQNGKNTLKIKRKEKGLLVKINHHPYIAVDLPAVENKFSFITPYIFAWGQQTIAFDDVKFSSWDPKVDELGWQIPGNAKDDWKLIDYYLLRTAFCAIPELKKSNTCACLSDEITRRITAKDFANKNFNETTLKDAMKTCVPEKPKSPQTSSKTSTSSLYSVEEVKLSEDKFPQKWEKTEQPKHYKIHGEYPLFAQIMPLPKLPNLDKEKTQVIEATFKPITDTWDWSWPGITFGHAPQKGYQFALNGTQCFLFNKNPTMYSDPDVKLIGSAIPLKKNVSQLPKDQSFTLKMVRKPNRELVFYLDDEFVYSHKYEDTEEEISFYISSVRASTLLVTNIEYWEE